MLTVQEDSCEHCLSAHSVIGKMVVLNHDEIVASRTGTGASTKETAALTLANRILDGKGQIAEDLWNTRDPERVAAAYTEDTQWRNRIDFLSGRAAVVDFLTRKWERKLEYKLKKELWGSEATGWR